MAHLLNTGVHSHLGQNALGFGLVDMDHFDIVTSRVREDCRASNAHQCCPWPASRGGWMLHEK